MKCRPAATCTALVILASGLWQAPGELNGIAMTLTIREVSDDELAPHTLRQAVIDPFKEFLGRYLLGQPEVGEFLTAGLEKMLE